MRQKVTATVIALTLGAFAAIGAFASQDKVDLGAAGRIFSGGVLGAATPAVDVPTATATGTVTATDTSTPDATSTGTPAATSTATPATARHDDDASETPEATETHGDDEHGDNGNHEGDECGHHGHHNGTATPDATGTPTPADTATPDTSGTATIVAQIPVHCHGEHGVEHDEGQHNGAPGNDQDHHDD